MPDRRAVLQPLASPAARIRARADVTQVDGLFALRNRSETPEEAATADLAFVAGAIESAGVPMLRIRDGAERRILAVDEADRVAVQRALIAASDAEPFYAVPLDRLRRPHGEAVLLADGELAPRTADLVRLSRPRVDAAGRLDSGDGSAVQLEFWLTSDADVKVPAPNALTRRRILRSELQFDTALLDGREWRTLAGMWDPLVDDVEFDVDVVFSWVDGTDKEWQRARARRMASYVVGEGDDAEARFRQIDELKYALRSVHAFLPWVRTIWVATDSPAPAWLADHPKVRIVRSEEFFEDPSVLPTHNSQAVEAQLHRIPGLAEHYIYSNDDMFVGRMQGKEVFFSPGGVTRFIEADTRIGLGDNDLKRSGFENAARVNRRLLQQRFGRTITRHLEHAAAPLTKSVVQALEAEFPADFAATAASPFRAATNISVTNSLYHYYALLTGHAVRNDTSSVLYVDTTTRAGLKTMKRLRHRHDVDFFCLNDGSFPEVGPEERAKKVRAFLERYFPVPAPWEKTERTERDAADARPVAG